MRQKHTVERDAVKRFLISFLRGNIRDGKLPNVHYYFLLCIVHMGQGTFSHMAPEGNAIFEIDQSV